MFVTSPQRAAPYLLFGMKTGVAESIQGSDLSVNSQEHVDRSNSWGAARGLEKVNS